MAVWIALSIAGLILVAMAWVTARVWADRAQPAANDIVQGKGTCTPKIRR